MKEKIIYESIDGKWFEHEQDALLRDFNITRQKIEIKVRFLSPKIDENQFWEIRKMLKILFGKYQELREREFPKLRKREHQHGTFSQGRIERTKLPGMRKAA